MSNNTGRKNSTGFLLQGSILAIASIISRIIGLLYRIPMTDIIGDAGNDYYGSAFQIYNILLIVSSYSLPLAVSKLVSANISQGKRRNVYRILKCALIFAMFSGTIAAAILFFGAEYITGTILKTPLSIFAVRTLIPVLIIMAFLGVMRGFFQGLGTMMPSAVSQILEQIANAIVSIWAAYVLYSYGTKVGALLGDAENYGSAYGAAGGTIGTGVGAFVAFLFAGFVMIVYLGRFKTKMRKERRTNVDSYGTIFRVLILTIVPVLLSTTIYNCNALLDQAVYKNIAVMQGYKSSEYGILNGIYTGKYQVLINVPIAIASSLAASSVPAVSAAYAGGRRKEVRGQIAMASRFIMVIAFPCAVGMGVLAGPILQMLFHDTSDTAKFMLELGSVTILFFSLSTLTNGLLQGINRMKEPIKNALIALVLHLFVLAGLMWFLDLNIYAVVIANAFFGFVMCMLNGRSLRKYSGYRQEVKRAFIIPAISAAGMGVVVYLVYQLILYVIRINTVAVILAILAGVFVYFVFLLLLRGVTEKELMRFPKGGTLVRIAKHMHLL